MVPSTKAFLKCDNTGCTQRCTIGNIDKHRKFCPFRGVSCPVPSCSHNADPTLVASSLIEHLKKHHHDDASVLFIKASKNTKNMEGDEQTNHSTACYHVNAIIYNLSYI